MLLHEELTSEIIGAAIEVHRHLGPGLLESAYEACLARELELRQIAFVRQWPLPINYKGITLEAAYRIDFLVADAVIVELKSVEALAAIHESQLLSHLKLSGKRVGLLINFQVAILKDGIVRRAL